MHPDWQTQLLRYCEAHSSPEPEYLKEAVRFTWLNTVNPRQLSGHLQGRLLALLSSMLAPTTILEVGTFTGYSALCLAEGLQPGGRLHSIEADSEMAFKATQVIEKTPMAEKITIHTGDAVDLIPQLNLSPDLIFIDAAKQQYKTYASLCLPMLKPGGVMMFDNTLWSMKVLETDSDTDTAAMQEFNTYLCALPGVQVVLLPVRDGLTLLRKL